MNPVDPSVTATSMISSNSLRSLDASTRYMGMIEVSAYKKTRNSLFQLFDYVSQTAPPLYAMHTIVTFWRLCQVLGPGFCANYTTIWGEGTIMAKVLNVLSIVFHIIPPSEREYIGGYVMIADAVIFFAVFGLVFGASFSFVANAKLPSWIPVFISFWFGSLGYILQPVAGVLFGETVGRMIMYPEFHATVVNIVGCVLVFIVLLVYLWLFSNVYAFSIMFKSDSFMTVVPNIQFHIFLGITTITTVSGLASQLSDIPRYAFTAATIVCYVIVMVLTQQKGGLVYEHQDMLLMTCLLSAAIVLIVMMIYDVTHTVANELVFIIYPVLLVLCYLVLRCISRSQTTKEMATLDAIEDDEAAFDDVGSARRACTLIVHGFRHAHPVCTSYAICKLALDRWPHNVHLWMIFAKFSAIYPEMTQQLAYISIGMTQNKLSGALAKHIHQQIQSVMRQRETNLIPQLKSKLDKIGKQVQGTKHKVRYIWDLIIQGNIKEIESVVERAYAAIDSCETEFLHLLRQFPNSRFVARAYARFLRDVVADHAGHKVWAQNVTLLQRGVAVIADQSHELGMRAFPLLPKTLEMNLGGQQQTTQILTEDTLTQEIEADDEQAAIDAELRMTVRESINHLRIPSITRAKTIRIVSLFILFIIPVIALTVFIPIYVNGLIEPLEFMSLIAYIRTTLFQVMGSVLHYSLENLNYDQDGVHFFPIDPPGEITGEEEAPLSLGGVYDSYDQAVYLYTELSETFNTLTPIMSFENGNEWTDKVRTLLYDEVLQFATISEPTPHDNYTGSDSEDDWSVYYNTTITHKSIHAAVMDFVIRISDYLQQNSVPEDIMNQPVVSILINNVRGVTEGLTTCLESLRSYTNEMDDELVRITTIIIGVVVCAVPIIYIICAVVIIRGISNEKMMIYKCLASLPKNVVSKVADSFKVLKREEDEEMKTNRSREEDLNKQEENLLKIFATSSDNSSTGASDLLIVVICTLFVVLCHIAITVLLMMFLQQSGNKLSESSPHINFITAAYAYDFAALLLVYSLISATAKPIRYHIVNFTPQVILTVMNDWLAQSETAYSSLLYGSEELDVKPFASLGAKISLAGSLHQCKEEAPAEEHDIYGCFSSNTLLAFTRVKVKSFVSMYEQNGAIPGNDFWLRHVWHIHQVHVFDGYFRELFDNVIPQVSEIIDAQFPLYIGISYGLLVVAIIVEFVFIRDMTLSEQRQKFALRLLLHCPGNVIVTNPNITSILAGNFKEKQIDGTNRKSEFYDLLLKEMPDSIIVMDLTGNIQTISNATMRIFGMKEEDLVGQNISVLSEGFEGENPFAGIFEEKDKTLLAKKSFEKTVVYKRKDESSGSVHLELTFSVIGDNCIASSRDVTQTVMYNRLIAEERAKSDKLLSSILPAKLVTRVQAGEKNISFSVQSATITFMDIVSFTPWCGSLPASKVMATLNQLFKALDRLVAIHTTMTKIKCIGDCYMAAGGIFAEINQPAEHARDVVEWGLDAIAALEDLNQQIGENLRIRVGINTGGPIVAGVLGTAKPTFEILGPAINMAQQMEHHGVPMKVHVSRAVYELIYGGSFVVKERGEVEIKNGSVVTYLIEKKKK